MRRPLYRGDLCAAADDSPLIQTLGATQQCAPEFQSYAILGALTNWLCLAFSSHIHPRTVR